MFFQLRLLLLLSPWPTKAQVQTCKRFFQLQTKKHRRLSQIMIARGGKRMNSIAAQCTRHWTALVLLNSTPSFFSPFLSVLWWSLTTVSVFLNLSLIVNCSEIFIPLYLQSAAYHASSFSLFCLYSFYLFIICDSLLFVSSCCLRKSVCLISCSLTLPHLWTHHVLVADCCIKFSSFFVASYLPLGLLACSLFSAAQD